MNWASLFGLFAKPLGAMINTGLAAGAGATIAYGAQHGVDASISTPIVGAIALGLSTIISGFAATQGVTIPIINNDPNNGVKVVSSSVSAPSVSAPIVK